MTVAGMFEIDKKSGVAGADQDIPQMEIAMYLAGKAV